MSAILVIPAFNEGARISDVLDAVTHSSFDGECVVIDDGSRDDTSDQAHARGATVLRHPFNLGYGAALQTGYKYAIDSNASLVVQMDADGQHDAEQIERLVEPIVAGRYDLVVGSRFLDPTGYKMGWVRKIGRNAFRAIARLTGLHVSDPTSGFQAMNRAVLDLYTTDFFPNDYPDVDVLLTAYRNGLRVGEVATSMSEGTRASTMHGGIRSLYYVYKMLLSTFSAGTHRRRVHPSKGSERS